MEVLKDKKRGRVVSEEAEFELYSPEVKRLRENLLDSLDDDTEFYPETQDLDSFMKSFEEEIIASPSASVSTGVDAVQFVDLTSESGDSLPDLGYLLEASDDELGIPPTVSSSFGLEGEAATALVRVELDSSEFGGEFWEVPGFDSFDFGLGGSETGYSGGNGEYVALDGLFEYSDIGFGSGDLGWKPEILPAQ